MLFGTEISCKAGRYLKINTAFTYQPYGHNMTVVMQDVVPLKAKNLLSEQDHNPVPVTEETGAVILQRLSLQICEQRWSSPALYVDGWATAAQHTKNRLCWQVYTCPVLWGELIAKGNQKCVWKPVFQLPLVCTVLSLFLLCDTMMRPVKARLESPAKCSMVLAYNKDSLGMGVIKTSQLCHAAAQRLKSSRWINFASLMMAVCIQELKYCFPPSLSLAVFNGIEIIWISLKCPNCSPVLAGIAW